MALAVAMITRIAVGRRVLPALVDGGHLSFVACGAFGFGCAFWLFELSSAATAEPRRGALDMGLSKSRTSADERWVLWGRALTISTSREYF